MVFIFICFEGCLCSSHFSAVLDHPNHGGLKLIVLFFPFFEIENIKIILAAIKISTSQLEHRCFAPPLNIPAYKRDTTPVILWSAALLPHTDSLSLATASYSDRSQSQWDEKMTVRPILAFTTSVKQRKTEGRSQSQSCCYLVLA